MSNELANLQRGDLLRLRRDLQVTQEPSGEFIGTHPAGSVWTFIAYVAAEDLVWLEQPDGREHTWDGRDLLDWFEPVNPGDAANTAS